MDKLLKATHEGELVIGESLLNCYVLEDGKRVISGSAVFRAFGRTKRGRKKDEVRVLNMPSFIDANNLQPFINEELRGVLKQIDYLDIKGKPNSGYEAVIIPLLCDVYLQARQEKVLKSAQLPLAQASEILVRSLSKIGIMALVDEATGYQYDRENDELQKILKRYISEELLPWKKRFPDEFYREIFRLNNWYFTTPEINKAGRPGIIGTWTKKFIYQPLPKGVLQALLQRTSRNEKGKLKHKLHQNLTREEGIDHLNKQIVSVVTLMNVSDNWKQFEKLWNKKFGQQELFNDETASMIEPKKIEDKGTIELSDFNVKLKKGLSFNPKKKE